MRAYLYTQFFLMTFKMCISCLQTIKENHFPFLDILSNTFLCGVIFSPLKFSRRAQMLAEIGFVSKIGFGQSKHCLSLG